MKNRIRRNVDASFRSSRAVYMAAQVAAVLVLFSSQAALANIMLVSSTAFTGTGLGAVPTILTIQDTSSEVGCVGFNGIGSAYNSTGVCGGSSADVKTGASQTGLQPLSAAANGSITTASQFAFIFNADQPAAGPITLTNAQVAFYSPGGAFLYESTGLTCSVSTTGCTFPMTFSGMGKSGFEFQLDTSQQAAATAAGVFSNPANLVGLSASATGSAGGPEMFYLLNQKPSAAGGGGAVSAVPESSSIVLSFMGLVLVMFNAIRRGNHT